jgi:hypothetical protein
MKNKGFEDLFEVLQKGLQSCVQLIALNEIKMFGEGIDYEYHHGYNSFKIVGTKDEKTYEVEFELKPEEVFVEEFYKMIASAKLLEEFGITLSGKEEKDAN